MITIVYGPPGAGKTTYIRDRRKTGDIVVDLDALCRALGSDSEHDHDRTVQRVAGAARFAAIRSAVEIGAETWVIDTWLRSRQLADISARYILVDPGETLTLEQAHADGRPEASIAAIRRWYANPPRPPGAPPVPAVIQPDVVDVERVPDWW